MVRIFLYEFVVGGGWYSYNSGSPPQSLLCEGLAMLRALIADFSQLDDVAIDVLRDVRYRDLPLPGCTIHEIGSAADEQQAIHRLASLADWTIVVAPEFRGLLFSRCRAVEQAGGELLGPASSVVALASDKHATAEHLAARGVPVPCGVALEPGEPLPADFPYPAVLKPRDGAGSQGVELVWCFVAGRVNRDERSRLERLCEGTPVSVAFLCGPRQTIALPPCRQRLGGDGRFAYLGGSLPIPPDGAMRATRLASRAVSSLSGLRGYLGVDLILGADPSGADDVVIEINPRLTTSYVGLRALLDGNMAAQMLAIVQRQPVELSWHSHSIQFEASGHVRPISP